MLKKCLLLNKFLENYASSRKFLSYLYVTGDKAREIYSPVQPYIDFDERIANMVELEENIKKRKINLDIHEIKTLWDFYKTRMNYKLLLESNRKTTKLDLEKLITNNSQGSKDIEIDQLKLKFKLIRDDLKNIAKTIWDIENNVVLKVLQVPNKLHPRTPDKEVVISMFGKKIEKGHDHLEMGKEFNCLDYFDRSTYYLKNELALFEIVTSQHLVNKFKSYGFIPTCNSDFSKSVLMEGCTLKSHSPESAFVLTDTDKDRKDKVYLNGGASFISFFGYHTKHVAKGGEFPIRYITSGRQYNPLTNDFNGLYSVWQSSAVEVFVSAHEENNLITEYDTIVQNLIEFYKTLNIHFRIVNVPASELETWERLRTSIQLYSPVNTAYIEVGYLSLIGDFISKRLRIYGAKEGNINFLNTISGTVIKMPILLANLLETSSKTNLYIPEVIKKEMIL